MLDCVTLCRFLLFRVSYLWQRKFNTMFEMVLNLHKFPCLSWLSAVESKEIIIFFSFGGFFFFSSVHYSKCLWKYCCSTLNKNTLAMEMWQQDKCLWGRISIFSAACLLNWHKIILPHRWVLICRSNLFLLSELSAWYIIVLILNSILYLNCRQITDSQSFDIKVREKCQRNLIIGENRNPWVKLPDRERELSKKRFKNCQIDLFSLFNL